MNTTSDKPAIGMIGTGLMGFGIASNLQQHGFHLNLLEHSGNQPLEKLLTNGAKSYLQIDEIARHSDIVIICVTGSPEVEQVLTCANGLLAGLKPGTIIIDCSTSLPDATRKNAAKIAAAGGEFLDAPMTRTPKEAMQGRLNLIVGGDKALFERCKPILSCFAENITYAGAIGSGHSMKLLHNYVSLGFATVLSEASACAEKEEIDPSILIDVLAKGGGAGVILERMTPFILNQDDSGFRFSIANAAKDLGYYIQMAQNVGATDQVAQAIAQLLAKTANEVSLDTAMPQLIKQFNQ